MHSHATGKSTLLERLAGLPLFPAQDGLSTTAAILVKLRRGPPAVPSMRVVNPENPEAPITGEREVKVAAELAADEIKKTMDRLARGQEVRVWVGLHGLHSIVIWLES
jgi:hypothetical protein